MQVNENEKRPSRFPILLPRTGLALGALLLSAGCMADVVESGEEDGLAEEGESVDTSFELFLATAEPVESGGFMTQGDIWAPDEEALFHIWSLYNDRSIEAEEGFLEGEWLPPEDDGTGLGTITAGLRRTSSLLSDKDLTFCIDTPTFSASEVTTIRSAITNASNQWQAQSGVRFREVPTTPCSNSTSSVDFNVRAANANDGTNFTARAWFPGYSRANRELLIRRTAITGGTFVGLMAHELGHMQGFIHEHAARDDAGCLEPSGSMVTRYDVSSVMHYPTCNGTMRTNTLSRYDRLGARCAYFGECEWIRNTNGQAIDIAAAGNQVWIIGTSRRLFRKRSDDTWQQMPGANGASIAVERNGTAWMVNTSNNIYRFSAANNRWDQMPGKALDIGAGGGQVWIIGTSRTFFKWNGSSSTWVQKPSGGNGMRITVASNGTPWMVNTSNRIYSENGSGWTQLPGTAIDIGAGRDGSVWITGTESGIFEFQASSGGSTSPEWIRVTGLGSRIAVDDSGTPWMINSGSNIYSNRWE